MGKSVSELGFCDERLARIQDWMQRYVDAEKLPGAVTYVARHGTQVFLGSAGKADIARGLDWSENTIARFYSMTKTVTSVALMMLYEKGLFHLDDPVEAFIPSFANRRVLRPNATHLGDTEPATTVMNIHHLLTHCSGLTYDFNEGVLPRAYAEKGMDFGPGRGNLQSEVDRLAELPLQFDPGARWNYGTSIDVVGRLVEIISGRSLKEFLHTEILEPLGMSDTGFDIADDKLDRFAAAYIPGENGGLQLIDDPEASKFGAGKVNCYSGGGGLLSTVADYVKFADMLRCGGTRNGVRLLGSRTAAYMMTNHMPGDLASMGQPVFTEVSYEGVGFGLGGWVMLEPTKSKMMGSPGDYGWGGMASTVYWIDPVEDLTIVFATQLIPSSFYPLRKELRALVHQSLID